MSKPYVGFWEYAKRGPGGESNSFSMGPDSMITRFFVHCSDFRYRLEGDSIKTEPIVPASLQQDTLEIATVAVHFALLYDTLVRTETTGRTEWLARVGVPPQGANSIVGAWKTFRSTDALTVHWYQRYHADGLLEMRLPMSKKSGIYKLTEESIVMILGEERDDTMQCQLAVRGDTLDFSIHTANGVFTYEYVHRGEVAWYTLEDY